MRSVIATTLLAGTIIGAGVFSLPYVVSRVGLVPGLLELLVFGAVYSVIHLMYAALSETRERDHQFFYFAHKYLPRWLAGSASYIILIELILVLTVYLTLVPAFAHTAFGVGGMIAVFGFWLLGSLFMHVSLRWLGIAEFVGTLSIVGIIALLVCAAWGMPLTTPSFGVGTIVLFLLPFGPLLFSLSGRPAIPEVVAEHRAAKKEQKPFSLTTTILVGTLIPVLLYAVFVVSVLKINPSASPEVLDSLYMLSSTLLSLLGVMGLLTLWTSYFIIGINVRDILHIDLHESRWIGSAIAWVLPLVLYIAGVQDFLAVVSFVGGIFLALEGIFVMMMWNRAFPTRRDRWVRWPLYFIFFLAIVYAIIHIVE